MIQSHRRGWRWMSWRRHHSAHPVCHANAAWSHDSKPSARLALDELEAAPQRPSRLSRQCSLAVMASYEIAALHSATFLVPKAVPEGTWVVPLAALVLLA